MPHIEINKEKIRNGIEAVRASERFDAAIGELKRARDIFENRYQGAESIVGIIIDSLQKNRNTFDDLFCVMMSTKSDSDTFWAILEELEGDDPESNLWWCDDLEIYHLFDMDEPSLLGAIMKAEPLDSWIFSN